MLFSLSRNITARFQNSFLALWLSSRTRPWVVWPTYTRARGTVVFVGEGSTRRDGAIQARLWPGRVFRAAQRRSTSDSPSTRQMRIPSGSPSIKLNGHGFEVDHRDSFSSVSKKIIQFCRGPLFMGMATLAPSVIGAFVESSDCIGLCGMRCAWCAFVLIKRFNEVKKVQGS